MHFYNNFRKECLRHGRFDMTPYPLLCFCGIVVAILHVSRGQAIGSPWVYPWIYPRKNLWIWMWIWMGNFISTASLPMAQIYDRKIV